VAPRIGALDPQLGREGGAPLVKRSVPQPQPHPQAAQLTLSLGPLLHRTTFTQHSEAPLEQVERSLGVRHHPLVPLRGPLRSSNEARACNAQQQPCQQSGQRHRLPSKRASLRLLPQCALQWYLAQSLYGLQEHTIERLVESLLNHLSQDVQDGNSVLEQVQRWGDQAVEHRLPLGRVLRQLHGWLLADTGSCGNGGSL
jgi:hypothetical protein